jgi:hypothetical protein
MYSRFFETREKMYKGRNKMNLKDYLHIHRLEVKEFSEKTGVRANTISSVTTGGERRGVKIGLALALKIEKATDGAVKANEQDWPNLSDFAKRQLTNKILK